MYLRSGTRTLELMNTSLTLYELLGSNGLQSPDPHSQPHTLTQMLARVPSGDLIDESSLGILRLAIFVFKFHLGTGFICFCVFVSACLCVDVCLYAYV